MRKILLFIFCISIKIFSMDSSDDSWSMQSIKGNPALLERIDNHGLNIIYFKKTPLSSTYQASLIVIGPNEQGFVIIENEGHHVPPDSSSTDLSHFFQYKILFDKNSEIVTDLHPTENIFATRNKRNRQIIYRKYNNKWSSTVIPLVKKIAFFDPTSTLVILEEPESSFCSKEEKIFDFYDYNEKKCLDYITLEQYQKLLKHAESEKQLTCKARRVSMLAALSSSV